MSGAAQGAKVVAMFIVVLIYIIIAIHFISEIHYYSCEEKISALIMASGIFPIGCALLMQSQKDEVPDFIRMHGLSHYYYYGLYFAFKPQEINGRLVMRIFFQNGYDAALNVTMLCQSPLVLFFIDSNLDPIMLEMTLPPGCFATADIPVAIPVELQGKKISYELSVRLCFPQENGKRILHRRGIHVRNSAIALDKIGRFFFHNGKHQPTKYRFIAPENVASSFTVPPKPHIECKWKLGDPMPSLET